ncbi:RGS-domain-containing protein, protein [Acrodontium crateriforme]|uniref:RGS-domain-containing protein, protein n=1 Tax=Acrodontium crateriforme TaxID=150365 RepID=A0AAQ3M8G4_9PEZI|nr:RGS-domain-containing protein, protein [Acrodontium crateriforme]
MHYDGRHYYDGYGTAALYSSLQHDEYLHADTLSVKSSAVPIVSSDAGSQHKLSDSSASKSSTDTSISEDEKSLLDDREWLASSDKNEEVALQLEPRTSHHDRYQEQRAPPPRKPRMMHQTSSRLLRMTEDDRPFTKDFKDLFSTLMVSLPLTAHRVRFSRIEHTFTTEEAMTNLGSLKFSQSNRMPDPKDPSRIVTTTTTTTFSMAREMARSVCQRFLDARFVESVDGKINFDQKNSVWQLSPKGMTVLQRFCQRNGIHQRHVNQLLDSPRNIMQLVILERETATDKLNSDSATIHVLFRRFAGDSGPNLKPVSSNSESESTSDYATGLMGVKMQRSRRLDRDAPYTFTGKSAFDWLMDCCTVIDKREVFELANLLISHGLIEHVGDDRGSGAPKVDRFAASKHVSYAITQKGMRVAGWINSPNGVVNGDAIQRTIPTGIARDSNTNRMTAILDDPALRLLFREYLRETHCGENLEFYIDVTGFLNDYNNTKRGTTQRLDVIRETLASAYSLYNAFLAPGSPCELNIDHNLRNALAARMTRAVGEDDQMVKSLDEVAGLFDQAQSSVFKLMASDSVPKFSREPKYASMLRERNLETMVANISLT